MFLQEKTLNDKSIQKIKDANLPVIIFGAGIVGESLFFACQAKGISVACFCDNNINKCQSLLHNTNIIHTSQIKQTHPEAIVIISAADIKDVIDQLSDLGYQNWLPGSIFLKDFDIAQHTFNAPYDFVEYVISTCLLCHDSFLTPEKLFLRSVDIVITERCSLKCRDCSNLMQYYQQPANYDIADIIKSIDAFCSIVDEINEFRVIGGEPFMHKEFHTIVKRLTDDPKVNKVILYTNGTIVPKPEQLQTLQNEKVLVFITNYGKLSRNVEKLADTLKEKHISHYVQEARGWTDCSMIKCFNRTDEQQTEIFNSCCAKNLTTLMKGVLYRCPYAANALTLEAVPNSKEDYIDIINESQKDIDIQSKKENVRNYLLSKKFLNTCDYCNGRSYGAPEITPAIQTKTPLEYTRYGR